MNIKTIIETDGNQSKLFYRVECDYGELFNLCVGLAQALDSLCGVLSDAEYEKLELQYGKLGDFIDNQVDHLKETK